MFTISTHNVIILFSICLTRASTSTFNRIRYEYGEVIKGVKGLEVG